MWAKMTAVIGCWDMKIFLTIIWAFWSFFVPAAHRAQQSTVPAPPPLMPMTTMSGLLRLVQTIALPTEGYTRAPALSRGAHFIRWAAFRTVYGDSLDDIEIGMAGQHRRIAECRTGQQDDIQPCAIDT